jgi:hypothetical protein
MLVYVYPSLISLTTSIILLTSTLVRHYSVQLSSDTVLALVVSYIVAYLLSLIVLLSRREVIAD